MRSRRLRVAVAGGLIVAAVTSQALYGAGWDNYLVSDDWYFLYWVSKAERWAQLIPLAFNTESFVRPTQWLLTSSLYRLFGTQPYAYHAVSQALDGVNALLLWFLARQVFSWFTTPHRASLASALMPVLFLYSWRHHEAVFWFSAVNELLAGVFRLATLNCLAWWLRVGRADAWVWLAMFLGSVLAILSKESAMMLPLEAFMLIALTRLAPRGRKTPWRAALVVLSAPALVVGTWAWLFIRTSTIVPGGLARGVSQTLTATPYEWLLRFVQFFNANYAGTEGLSASRTVLETEMVFLLALSALAIARGWYLWLFAVAWTLVAVSPYAAVSHGPDVGLVGVLDLGVRGDRFLYYSGTGASLVVVASGLWLHDELARRRASSPGRLAYQVGIPVLLLALLGAHAARLRTAEAEWDTAGRIVRQVVTRVRREWPRPEPTDTLCFARLPHTYSGKPVYRNGVAESLFLAYGRDGFAVERLERLPEAAAQTRCTATFVYAGLERGLVRARGISLRPADDRPAGRRPS